jgi:hypothetical protein
VEHHDRSWLSLLVFLALTTLASSLLFAAVLAGVTVAIAGGEPQQADPEILNQTFSGLVTDARCGPRHENSEQSASECARMCVRNGTSYILIDGDKSYELTGDLRPLDQLAGQRATLTGKLSGNMIRISGGSVVPPPHP